MFITKEKGESFEIHVREKDAFSIDVNQPEEYERANGVVATLYITLEEAIDSGEYNSLVEQLKSSRSMPGASKLEIELDTTRATQSLVQRLKENIDE